MPVGSWKLEAAELVEALPRFSKHASLRSFDALFDIDEEHLWTEEDFNNRKNHVSIFHEVHASRDSTAALQPYLEVTPDFQDELLSRITQLTTDADNPTHNSPMLGVNKGLRGLLAKHGQCVLLADAEIKLQKVLESLASKDNHATSESETDAEWATNLVTSESETDEWVEVGSDYGIKSASDDSLFTSESEDDASFVHLPRQTRRQRRTQKRRKSRTPQNHPCVQLLDIPCPDAFERLLLHCFAQFYHVNSHTRVDPSGKRRVVFHTRRSAPPLTPFISLQEHIKSMAAGRGG